MNDYSWMYDDMTPVESDKCKVGDTVHYHYEDCSYIDDFDCKITFIGRLQDDDIVRIFAENKGCLVYEHNFDEMCKVIS